MGVVPAVGVADGEAVAATDGEAVTATEGAADVNIVGLAVGPMEGAVVGTKLTVSNVTTLAPCKEPIANVPSDSANETPSLVRSGAEIVSASKNSCSALSYTYTFNVSPLSPVRRTQLNQHKKQIWTNRQRMPTRPSHCHNHDTTFHHKGRAEPIV
jgi:hypothetical protein